MSLPLELYISLSFDISYLAWLRTSSSSQHWVRKSSKSRLIRKTDRRNSPIISIGKKSIWHTQTAINSYYFNQMLNPIIYAEESISLQMITCAVNGKATSNTSS